jgi:SAM-dependent MidA family methyltransferase
MTTSSPVQLTRFDHFMEQALYGDSGFYTTGSGAGTRRDFLTSPEVGSLFGAVLARRIDAEWFRLGQPSEFQVVEVGAGPGTLARTVVAASPACIDALRYVMVERSPGMQQLHTDLPDRVRSTSMLPTQPFRGMVIGNEILDNIPSRMCTYLSDGWREIYIDEELHVVVQPIDEAAVRLLSALVPAPEIGQTVPLHDDAAALVRDLCDLTLDGSVILIDYARETTQEFAGLPVAQWLRSYRQHRVQAALPPLPVGTADITVDVALDQMPLSPRCQTQAAALVEWGIDQVLAQSAAVWSARISDWDLVALRHRSHQTEAPALMDANGLGGFVVMEWRVGWD